MNRARTRDAHAHPKPLFFFAVSLLLLAGLAPAAEAAGCDGCPGPTVRDLRSDPAFVLRLRYGHLGQPFSDYYELDRGECHATAKGRPEVKRLRSWLVLRGQGEVWNCPHSKSEDSITIVTQEADSTAWSLKTKVGAEMKTAVAKLKVEVEAGRTGGVTITEVTKVTKTISPGYCRRIAWQGWFEVGEFEATGEFEFRQRWAWWTKNPTTGDKVHAAGDVWVACGSSSIVLDRKAPVSGHFDLNQRGCSHPRCQKVLSKHLGWFPPLPPHLPDPNEPDTPDEDEDEPFTPDLPATNEDPLPDDLGEPPTGPLPDPLGNR